MNYILCSGSMKKITKLYAFTVWIKLKPLLYAHYAMGVIYIKTCLVQFFLCAFVRQRPLSRITRHSLRPLTASFGDMLPNHLSIFSEAGISLNFLPIDYSAADMFQPAPFQFSGFLDFMPVLERKVMFLMQSILLTLVMLRSMASWQALIQTLNISLK